MRVSSGSAGVLLLLAVCMCRAGLCCCWARVWRSGLAGGDTGALLVLTGLRGGPLDRGGERSRLDKRGCLGGRPLPRRGRVLGPAGRALHCCPCWDGAPGG